MSRKTVTGLPRTPSLPRTPRAEGRAVPARPTAVQPEAAPADAFNPSQPRPVDRVAAATAATAADLQTVADVARLAHESALTVSGDRALGDVVAQLQRIKALDTGPRLDVTIIGAGMSGLAAAYELENLGHRVRILEGNDRVGGRVLTHRFPDGAYHDLGAMRIPASHDYTRHYVSELGLALRDFKTAGTDRHAFYDVAGVTTTIEDAERTLYSHFDLAPQDAHARVPGAIAARIVEETMQSLSEEEKASLYSTHLVGERLQKLEKTSIRDFLLEHLNAETVELIATTAGIGWALDNSALWLLRGDGVRREAQGLQEIVGGMDQLPKALAGRLKAKIELGATITGFHTNDDGTVQLKVSRDGGPPQVEQHAVVITSLPFPVMKGLENNFSPEKRFAMEHMSYASAYKLVLNTVDRFWESKYDIHGGASQTPIGAIYYPEARDALLEYVWGDVALELGSLTPEEQERRVVAAIARFHPEIENPGEVKGSASILWDANPWSKSAFSVPKPGQHDLYAAALKPEGGVHFMGEHTSLDQGWIQGALISALRAVEELVTAGARAKAQAGA